MRGGKSLGFRVLSRARGARGIGGRTFFSTRADDVIVHGAVRVSGNVWRDGGGEISLRGVAELHALQVLTDCSSHRTSTASILGSARARWWWWWRGRGCVGARGFVCRQIRAEDSGKAGKDEAKSKERNDGEVVGVEVIKDRAKGVSGANE